MTRLDGILDTGPQLWDRLEIVPLSELEANPWQPRRNFDLIDLAKLAENIRENGLINAITVRVNPDISNGVPKYQIAAGERRWRAVKMLRDGYVLPAQRAVGGTVEAEAENGFATGPDRVPGDSKFDRLTISVRHLDDEGMMQTALGENGQRSNITAMEEALAFSKMIDKLGVTQTEFGQRMGLSQSFVANRLRMLNLPETFRDFWITGKLTQWHAIKLLEWQSKFNLTLPYMSFLAAAFSRKQITTSFLDDGLFEEKIASLSGGSFLLKNNPLPVQGNMLEEIEEETTPPPAPALTYPVPAAAPIPTPPRPAPAHETEETEEELGPVTPIVAPTKATPAPAPVVEEATLASASQAQPNIEQAKKDAAAAKFAEKYSSKFLLGQPPAPIDGPTCRLLARLLIINTYLRVINSASLVVRMQEWLRAHNLTDDLAPVQMFPLPVVWIDQQLESFREEFYRNPEVIQTAVAMTTECALATGEFNNSIFQGELYTYIRAALAEAAKKAEEEE